MTVASWAPIDLGPFFDGTVRPVVPSLLPRTDGVALIYPGLTHSLHGESESGKSWVAQAEAARILSTGGRVLFVDFESDAGAIVERLRLLEADDDAVRARFAYVHPEVDPRNPNEAATFEAMLTQRFDLAVLDGVTDAVGLFGLESRDNDALTQWARLLPKRIADATGAAVVMVDHVTKDAESRGRFAIGGQAKLATITGAAYTVETAQPLGRGLRGVIVLRVAKDRPGYIRGHSGRQRASDRTQEAARIIVDSTLEGVVTVTVEPPSDNADSNSTFRPTTLMERISEALEARISPATTNHLIDGVGGKAEHKRTALTVLITEGYIAVTDGPNRSRLHTSTKPYRQADDPLSDAYVKRDAPGASGGYVGASVPYTGGRDAPTQVRPGRTGDAHSWRGGRVMTRTRNRASAKQAGSRFETLVATYLAEALDDDRIERRARTGAKDRGDIAGVRHVGARVVIECKDCAQPRLSQWATEAEVERGNDDAVAGLIVHKRHGRGDPADQWVTCTLGGLVALLTGHLSETEAHRVTDVTDLVSAQSVDLDQTSTEGEPPC